MCVNALSKLCRSKLFFLAVACAAAEDLVSCPGGDPGTSSAGQCSSFVQVRSLTARAPAPPDVDAEEHDAVALQDQKTNVPHQNLVEDGRVDEAALPPAADTSVSQFQQQAVLQQNDGKGATSNKELQAAQAQAQQPALLQQNSSGDAINSSAISSLPQRLMNLSMSMLQNWSSAGRSTLAQGTTLTEHAIHSWRGRAMLELRERLREPPKAPSIFLAFALFTVLVLGSLFLCFIAVGGESQFEESPRGKAYDALYKASGEGQKPASAQSQHPEIFLTSQREAPARAAGVQFCPELVVPSGRECVLLVPMVSNLPLDEEKEVADLRGNPVLRIGISSGRSTGQSISSLSRYSVPGDARKISLLAAGSGEELAYCIARDGIDGQGKKSSGEFAIYHASGELFGNVQGVRLPDWEAPEERYVLSAPSGRLHFWGALEDFALNVTDDRGVLLATTERCSVDFESKNEFFRLRVAPLADVGLVLCGLLSLGKLEDARLTSHTLTSHL